MRKKSNTKTNKKLDLTRKKKARLIKRIKKNLFFISITSILVLLAFFNLSKIYINYKCKDLNYSINYNLTNNGNLNVKLLRVQNYDIISNSENTAIVKAYGLSYDEPHRKTESTACFKKDTNDIWMLHSLFSTCTNY